MTSETLLDIRNLTCSFRTADGAARAVDDVSFSVTRGETLGVVGESGCGKTVTALAILRLIPSPPGRIDGGKIVYKGTDLLSLPEREMRKIRGNEISMIFQEPMTSLNPVFTLRVPDRRGRHSPPEGRERKRRRERTVEMLHLVGNPDPAGVRRLVSAPAERRDAAAGHDRDGPLVPPEPAHRGRAHHRARRDDPGADPRTSPVAPGAPRYGGADDHSRPRRRGRDRPAGRGHVRRARSWRRGGSETCSTIPVTRTRSGCRNRSPAGPKRDGGSRRSPAGCRIPRITRRGAGSATGVLSRRRDARRDDSCCARRPRGTSTRCWKDIAPVESTVRRSRRERRRPRHITERSSR